MDEKKMKVKSLPKIVITGGGSGGHTVTAITVIDELIDKKAGIKERLLYVGGTLGMEGEKDAKSFEERMAREKGIKFVGIRSGKLQRKFSIKTIWGLRGVVGGIIDASKLLRENDVSYVFSTGGYVSVPVCFAAWLRKIPVVIHEQTTRVGLSNKISARFSKKILLGFSDAAQFFKNKKISLVGNTVRKEVLSSRGCTRSLRSKLSRYKSNSKQYPIILISGGGQGSHVMNTNVFMAMKSLVSHFHLIVITGDNKVNRDYDKLIGLRRKLSNEQQKRIIIEKFYTAEELGAYFDAADVFVGRGGALSVYEAGVVNIPSVLIPIPWVTHNEQYHNAKVLEDIGLAKIVSEGVLSPEILFQEIQRMVSKMRGGLLRVDEVQREKIFVTDAAKKIVKELERIEMM